MSHNNITSPPGQFPKIDIAYKTQADFTFTIVTQGPVTFANDPNAIWIQKGTAKPKSGVDGQITNLSGGGTKVLKFHDTNIDKSTLTYTLNFTAGAPQIDPIIENGGGGLGMVGWDAYLENPVVIGAGILILIGVIALLARRFRSDDRAGTGPV
jgi:hypothetical protein